MLRGAAFDIQTGQVERCLPVAALGGLPRQLYDFLIVAVFFPYAGGFHRACFEEPVIRLCIDRRHLCRLHFAGEDGAVRIEERQTLVSG